MAKPGKVVFRRKLFYAEGSIFRQAPIMWKRALAQKALFFGKPCPMESSFLKKTLRLQKAPFCGKCHFAEKSVSV